MIFRKHHAGTGSKPGSVRVKSDWPEPTLHVIRYSADQVAEFDLRTDDSLDGLIDEASIVWVDVQGLGNESLLRRMAELFHLHPLAVADVFNVPQRPKVESYGDTLFMVTRMFSVAGAAALENEQISIFLGTRFVLTFQERPGDVFDPVRTRLRISASRIRESGPDYLAYALLDAVIDSYYPLLERLGDRLAELEEESLEQPSKQTLRATNSVRMDLLLLRRVLWPQREAINSLHRDPNPMISDHVRLFLRDTLDHCTQVTEVVESYRELVSAVANTYLTVVSHRTNEVMKVLTIMASIFIPLTFMAGIYGMNFEYMPELNFRYGYPLLWLAMLIVGGGMVLFFYRKGWLDGEDDD